MRSHISHIGKIAIFAVCLGLLTGCNDTKVNSDTSTVEETVSYDNWGLTYSTIRKEYNEAFSAGTLSLTSNDAPDGFSLKLEAEDAELSKNVEVVEVDGFSGGKFVDGPNSGRDTVTFRFTLDNAGFYDINFVSRCDDSVGRANKISVNGSPAGELKCNSGGKLVDCVMKYVRLEAGENTISITPYWGYIDYDCIEITKSVAVNDSTYNVSKTLSNPNADERARRLYSFLVDIYGKYTLSGQYANKGRLSREYEVIEKTTGENFAVLGMDMFDYDGVALINHVEGKSVEYAYDWYVNGGGIVTLLWHWHSPQKYLYGSSDHPWYSSFYAEHTKLDLDKIMSGEDAEGYDLLMEDIDRISEQLARLRDAGVPIIWRPLHESGGNWFWWGSCSPESYKKLWRAMYDKMTNEHNLTNLIWMWNGDDPAWYPGDDVVDIISVDLYQGEHVYGSHAAAFVQSQSISGVPKLIALSENGTIMDPDLVNRDNVRWLFWATWAEPYTLKNFILNEEYTEKSMLIKAYESEYTLTLAELPDLKSYPLE